MRPQSSLPPLYEAEEQALEFITAFLLPLSFATVSVDRAVVLGTQRILLPCWQPNQNQT